jgi:hypothetical protein
MYSFVKIYGTILIVITPLSTAGTLLRTLLGHLVFLLGSILDDILYGRIRVCTFLAFSLRVELS